MASDLLRLAGTAANVDRDAKNAWSNPDNAKTDDLTYASVSIAKSTYSDWLRLTNFGFSLIYGAAIVGIEATIKRYGSNANEVSDSALYLRKTSGQTGNNKASATAWPTSVGTATYGGSTDMWGTTLTYADINSSDFGIDLSAANSNGISARTAYVDYIKLSVYYNSPILVNVSGTFKEVVTAYVNVSGTFKTITEAYVNVAGTWKSI